MDFKEKERLARFNDETKQAAGIRLKAAREAIGFTQTELGKAGGVKTAAISNAENGAAYPGRGVLMYLFREHRIDFNFTMAGAFSGLPADVQERLFAELVKIDSKADPKPN